MIQLLCALSSRQDAVFFLFHKLFLLLKKSLYNVYNLFVWQK